MSAFSRNARAAPLRQRLQPVRQALRRSLPGFLLSRLPVTGEMMGPPPAVRHAVLVCSLPRAGSSWVGRILGLGEDALYLREPLTQSYLRHLGPGTPPFFEWEMCRDRHAYDRLAELAFRGIPRFPPTVVPYPRQWSLRRRRSKHLVVKEVNPLVARRFWDRFRPKLVLLVRHPVSVARSFHALGWTGDQLSGRFRAETLTAFHRQAPLPAENRYWAQSGAFQAIAQNVVAEGLRDIDHLVVRYEDLCTDPVAEFERIFAYCELAFRPAIRDEVLRSSQADPAYAPGRYDTVRNSRAMATRWKSEVAPNDIADVRRGYFACRPLFYTDAADW